MEPRVEDLIDNARQNIDRGRFLLAADSVLDVASDLMNNAALDEPELRLEVSRLKGFVARDRFDVASAILHFDQARAYGSRMGRWGAVCELSMGKATAAGVALNGQLASTYLADARREASALGDRRPPVLEAELIAREVQLLELAGDLTGAEHRAKEYLHLVRRMDEPSFVVSRLSTLARIQLQRTGVASVEVEGWLAEAGDRVHETGSTLRALQWQVSMGMFLEKIGDQHTHATISKVRHLMTVGQLRHRPAEMLLNRYGYHGSGGPRTTNGREVMTVTYNIGGSGHNISFGGQNYTQISQSSAVGNRELLHRTLAEAGIPEPQLAELDAALAEDAAEDEKAQAAPGPAVQKWYERVSETAGKVAIGAAGGVLGRAIAAYFGLG